MTTNTFIQPNFLTQDAATYKSSIDNGIGTLAELALQFAPREMAIPGMGITVEAGLLQDGTVVLPQNVTGFVAPTGNPRVDRVCFNLNTKAYVIIQGTPAATPAEPAMPYGCFPVASVLVGVGVTAITNFAISDERALLMMPFRYTANTVRLRLSGKTAADKFVVEDSDGKAIFSIDGTGVVRALAAITPNTAP